LVCLSFALQAADIIACSGEATAVEYVSALESSFSSTELPQGSNTETFDPSLGNTREQVHSEISCEIVDARASERGYTYSLPSS
jgi:hypothetical protein